MRDALTSVLDIIGLLAIAVGIYLLIGNGWGFVASGVFLLAGSFMASALSTAPKRSDE